MLLRAENAHVCGLGALVALLRLELDLRALIEGLEARAFDRAEMDEEVLASLVRRDEAEALVRVEPLDGSGCHAHTSSTAYSRTCSGKARTPNPVLVLMDCSGKRSTSLG